MKQSELLRKQADIIDLAEKHGIDDWRKLVKVTNGHGEDVNADFAQYSIWFNVNPKFALGVVEGKPVFEGDELYYTGNKARAVIAQKRYEERIVVTDGGWILPKDLTWNLPKPKTILVELLVEDAEFLVSDKVRFCYKHGENIQTEVRKALESIKQS